MYYLDNFLPDFSAKQQQLDLFLIFTSWCLIYNPYFTQQPLIISFLEFKQLIQILDKIPTNYMFLTFLYKIAINLEIVTIVQ